ncbi:MAG: monofunctional biosynthetic peptidoglycan transglycosylase [Verrucomicrobiae bacterium]|nr:monofunctional biosynthetic peptidoglycan transglycosylase [Verrucomicrobiae bacterium]
MKTSKSKWQRLRRWSVIGIIAALLLPGLQVAALWLVNPPTTGPMVWRWGAGKFEAQPYVANQYRWVDLNAVSPNFTTAVWLWEDHRFFEHWGFDWVEIQNAWAQARATGKPARGASTITQQCARSLFLWQGRSWVRKGLEAYYSVWMELLLSKHRIFEVYVNVIELGAGIYGVEAAARHYYGVSAHELTREQAALLVAMMPQPKVLDPRQPTAGMLVRQEKILERADGVDFPLPE